MIVLDTIYSNIQQYALIDVQLNEKTPGYWQKYPETQTTPKNPDLSWKKPSCGNTGKVWYYSYVIPRCTPCSYCINTTHTYGACEGTCRKKISISCIRDSISCMGTRCILCICILCKCILCKVMESIVRDKVMDHFVKNKLFTNKQFGFLKGRSAISNFGWLDRNTGIRWQNWCSIYGFWKGFR